MTYQRFIKKHRRAIALVQALALVTALIPQPAAVRAAYDELPSLPVAAVQTEPRGVNVNQDLPVNREKPVPVMKTVWVTVTAYSSTVDQTDADPFTTANGTKVRDGIVAWNGVPFGTKVRFPGNFNNKVFEVADRLNARASHYHLDVWMPTRQAALQWGKRVVPMQVLSF